MTTNLNSNSAVCNSEPCLLLEAKGFVQANSRKEPTFYPMVGPGVLEPWKLSPGGKEFSFSPFIYHQLL